MTTDTLSTGEVAAMFSVTTQTVTRWANTGRLPCFRTPSGRRRFNRADVEAHLHPETAPVAASA